MNKLRKQCLQGDLPEAGEYREMQDGDMLKFRFRYGFLQQNDLLFKVPDTNIMVVSPSDGMCLWKCCASMAHGDPLNPKACQDSFSQALTVKDDTQEDI